MPCRIARTASGSPAVSIPFFPASSRRLLTGRHAGAADAATHKIYIWDILNNRQFASMLDGGHKPLVHTHVRFNLVPSPVGMVRLIGANV